MLRILTPTHVLTPPVFPFLLLVARLWAEGGGEMLVVAGWRLARSHDRGVWWGGDAATVKVQAVWLNDGR
eukprot:720464-Hanusia_phi.AAC.1